MATKKQKRAAALARRQDFMKQATEDGLKALRQDRLSRRKKEFQEWENNHDKNHTGDNQLVKECPHCRVVLSENKRAAKEARRKNNKEKVNG